MRHIRWFGLCALLFAAVAMAQAMPEKVYEQNGMTFVSGGIGVASQERLKAREQEFNLKLVFTLVEGNYLADIAVTIKDGAGKTVIGHVADGPFFMAKLPAGSYTVTATHGGKAQTRKVALREGLLRTEYLRWPSNPKVDVTLPPEGAGSARAPKAVQEPKGMQAPAVVREGAQFVSGGIGVASQQQLLAREQEFNLKLVFSLIEGNYVADVGVTIRDGAGKTVIEHVADGPFFMAKLPAGTYSVTAVYEGKSRAIKVAVREGRLRTEYLRWPSNPKQDLPVSRWLEPEEQPKPKAGSRPGS